MATETDLATAGTVLKNRWRVERKIGGGGFGQIYTVRDLKTNKFLAMKTESNKTSKQTLKMEVTVLKKLQGRNHVCKFYGCGRQKRYNYIIMALVGKNLSDLRKEAPNGILSLSTVFRILRQMINCLEMVHEIGFLHRDVKPNNFAMGCTKETFRTVFVLDYGLARLHISVVGEVRPPRKIAGFRGTLRYASINSHFNKELGRVDDFWCLFYLTVEFTKGNLPWSKLGNKDDIGKCKLKTDHAGMIHHLPGEFGQYLDHIQHLNYNDQPNYDHLKHVCDRILTRYKIRPDEPFDWEVGNNCSAGRNSTAWQPPINNGSCPENDKKINQLRMQTFKACSNVGIMDGTSTHGDEYFEEMNSSVDTQ